jgi:hypothetical protein
MDDIEITFEVFPTNPCAKLGFEAWLDNQLIFDTDHVQELTKICMSVSNTDADHVLKIVLKNKLSEHTQLTDSGEIASDAVLQINKLSFDGIVSSQLVDKNAVYTHNFNGTANQIQDQFFGTMCCTGEVTLKFTTPIYLWLLEHM